jgi:hypothetical protein
MNLFTAACAMMGLLKATIPALLCGAALLYCAYQVHRVRNSYFAPDTNYKVDIVVHAPDGTEVKPLRPAPH